MRRVLQRWGRPAAQAGDRQVGSCLVLEIKKPGLRLAVVFSFHSAPEHVSLLRALLCAPSGVLHILRR